jgi:excisionase family DNA binding protein
MALLNTKAAGERLGITPRRVAALIASGRLRAEKVGRDWVIEEADLARVAERPPGNKSGKSRRKPKA